MLKMQAPQFVYQFYILKNVINLHLWQTPILTLLTCECETVKLFYEDDDETVIKQSPHSLNEVTW